jgi:Fur family transcriptional regulator, peroxide stress response regulator
MIATEIRFSELITAPKECDFRLTPQRVVVVRLIASSEGLSSATQLYVRIKHHFPAMSHATVFKTLALLKDIGRVLKIDLHNDSHCDGYCPQPNPHLICIKCKKIINGEAAIEPFVTRKLEQASGYMILQTRVSFCGLCPDCKQHN